MKKIMEEYSTTFIDCMKVWPHEIKEDVYKLYAYLRVIDEMVEGAEGKDFKEWRQIIEQFHEVSAKYEFKGEWLEDFHHAMFSDLVKKEHTITSMLEYCKGSAESVGMMMASIFGCPPEAEEYARALGKAYQIINFIRDYDDDIERGYHYITKDHSIYLKMFFEELDKGMEGLRYIPEELQSAIITASIKYMEIADECEASLL